MTKKNKKGENTVNNEVNIDKIIKVKKEEVELIPEDQTEKTEHDKKERIFLYKNNKLVSDNNDVKVIIGDETESYIDKIKADLERRTQERCIALGF